MQSYLKENKSEKIKESLEKKNIFNTKNYTRNNNKNQLVYKLYLFEDEKENDEQVENHEIIRKNRNRSFNLDINNSPLIDSNDFDEEDKEIKNCGLKRVNTISGQLLNSFVKEGKIFAINFMTQDHRARPLVCKANFTVNEIENKLVKEFPELKSKQILYTVNGKAIDPMTTFGENGIKDGDTILISKSEFEDDDDKNDKINDN